VVFDSTTLPNSPKMDVEINAESLQWGLVPIDGSLIPVLVVDYGTVCLCYDSRDGSLLNLSDFIE
jgi:hypothetical protein